MKNIKLGITNNHQIINNTNSPDEFLSEIVFMLDSTCNTISEYTKQISEELKIDNYKSYEEVRDDIFSALSLYNMKQSGMSDKDIADITGIEFEVEDIDIDYTDESDKN